MKKTILLLFLCCCFYSHAQTPDWVWARGAQSSQDGLGRCIATDKNDNVFVSGYYYNSITFGSYTLTSQTGVFLAKYDSNGNIKWAKTSTGSQALGYAVATDAQGNCYITGSFTSLISFGSHTLLSAGGGNVFLIKCDPAGNVIWAKSAGGINSDYGSSVCTDASGNVYITGTFNSPLFSIGAFTLINAGNQDFFIAKYDSSGKVLWAKSTGGTATDVGYSVATDAFANVYVTGNFNSASITFGSYTVTSSGGDNVFLAKYDSSGTVLWAKSAYGTSNNKSIGSYVAIDVANNAYITGTYNSITITFGSYTLNNAGNYDAFFVKYSSSGNVLWAKNIGGINQEYGWCAAANDKIYITGGFHSPTVTFDTITVPRPPGYIDPLYLACYDSSGHALWAKALVTGGDAQNAVALGPTGCIYVGGSFRPTIFIVGNDTLQYNTGDYNVFVAKLCNTGLMAYFTSSDTVFCNETGKCISFIDHSTGNPTSWQWSFTGATPNSSTLQNPDSICYSSPGTYPVSLIVGNASGYDTLTVASMIIVGNPPLPPVITVGAGDTLYSSYGATYQWYLNGSPIPNATDSFIVAHVWGVYSVVTTDGFGCNAQSAGTTVSVDEIRNGVGVEIFPNPVGERLSVMGLEFGVGARFEIFDVLGNKVYCPRLLTPNPKLQTVIDVSSLSNGIYLLKVRIDRLGTINRKFVVVHK